MRLIGLLGERRSNERCGRRKKGGTDDQRMTRHKPGGRPSAPHMADAILDAIGCAK